LSRSPHSAITGGLVSGLPDNGVVYLFAYATTPIGAGGTTVEVSIENNGGAASAYYPTGPDEAYDDAADADDDGWDARFLKTAATRAPSIPVRGNPQQQDR
jgi:hypothetical protein